jgi:hypothetical protein
MDIIFKKAYKESNNFIEFWGAVIFYFHTERGLPINVTIKEAEKWYVEHRKRIIDIDKVREVFERKISEFIKGGGIIPEWDGVSGVKELEEKINILFEKEDQRIFDHNKKELG